MPDPPGGAERERGQEKERRKSDDHDRKEEHDLFMLVATRLVNARHGFSVDHCGNAFSALSGAATRTEAT